MISLYFASKILIDGNKPPFFTLVGGFNPSEKYDSQLG